MNNEWGNIELPGLSDEELLSKDWNRVGRNLERENNPEYKAKHKEGLKRRGEDWRKKKSQISSQLAQDPDWQAKHKEGLRRGVQKRIQTPDGIFDSLNQARQHYDVNICTIHDWLKKFPDKFYRLDK